MGALADWADSEAVLPAYLIGMALAGTVGKDHALIRRLRADFRIDDAILFHPRLAWMVPPVFRRDGSVEGRRRGRFSQAPLRSLPHARRRIAPRGRGRLRRSPAPSLRRKTHPHYPLWLRAAACDSTSLDGSVRSR